jgi:hypothetical protein
LYMVKLPTIIANSIVPKDATNSECNMCTLKLI